MELNSQIHVVDVLFREEELLRMLSTRVDIADVGEDNIPWMEAELPGRPTSVVGTSLADLVEDIKLQSDLMQQLKWPCWVRAPGLQSQRPHVPSIFKQPESPYLYKQLEDEELCLLGCYAVWLL
jgi:hypothetical protein